MTGWVKIHRTIRNNWLWTSEPYSKGQAWIDLILNANHSPAKFMIKGQLVSVERGQQARSIETLCSDWQWSRNKVKRFLGALKSDGMLDYQANHLTTIITICNYNDFQGKKEIGELPNEQPSEPTDGHLTNQQTNYKQECKEEIKNAEEINYVPFERFWPLYPKKKGKAVAKKKWEKLKITDDVFQVIKNHLSIAYLNTEFKFIPDGSTYVNQQRWQDEVYPNEGNNNLNKATATTHHAEIYAALNDPERATNF